MADAVDVRVVAVVHPALDASGSVASGVRQARLEWLAPVRAFLEFVFGQTGVLRVVGEMPETLQMSAAAVDSSLRRSSRTSGS